MPLPFVGVEPLDVVVVGEACGVMVMDCGRVMPRLRTLVAVDLEDGDVDDDLRAGAVEVVHELLREEKLVGRGAQDDGVLAGDERDLDAGIEQVADSGEDFVGVAAAERRW